jgi:hypothetical protein
MKFTKETARRALRTFIQAFIPALLAGIKVATLDSEDSFTWGAVIALVVPAVSAGIAAVMNLEWELPTGEEGYYDE